MTLGVGGLNPELIDSAISRMCEDDVLFVPWDDFVQFLPKNDTNGHRIDQKTRLIIVWISIKNIHCVLGVINLKKWTIKNYWSFFFLNLYTNYGQFKKVEICKSKQLSV
jgi:hypothetical protein